MLSYAKNWNYSYINYVCFYGDLFASDALKPLVYELIWS